MSLIAKTAGEVEAVVQVLGEKPHRQESEGEKGASARKRSRALISYERNDSS